MTVSDRPDYSHYLAHFTGRGSPTGTRGLTKLLKILMSRTLEAQTVPWQKNRQKIVCFTECPWSSLTVHVEEYSDYGLGFTKEFIYNRGGNPVMYLRGELFNQLESHTTLAMRSYITPFQPAYRSDQLAQYDIKRKDGTTPPQLDYSHEREWRLENDLRFTKDDIAFVAVKSIADVERIQGSKATAIDPNKFIVMDMYRKIQELWPAR